MSKIILQNHKLTLSKDFNVKDIALLKKVLKKHHKDIHSVYPEGELSIISIYILKKYLEHNNIEVPKKYQEQWDLLDTKLPNVPSVVKKENILKACQKTAEIFSLNGNDEKQNHFWIDTFVENFMHFTVDNAMIIFVAFMGIGISLTYLFYGVLFDYGIELEAAKLAMAFGLKIFCPMMSVILLTAKSCTASSAIIKTMWINGDFKVMHMINLPYKQVYLHPLFAACAVSGPLINLVAIFGTLVGACISWLAKGHSIELFFAIISEEFYMKYILNSELRAFLASTFAGVCMCIAGLIPGRDFQSLISVISTCITLSFLSNIFVQAVVSLF